MHRLSQLRWKWLHAEDHPEMLLRNILGGSRDQVRVRSSWRKVRHPRVSPFQPVGEMCGFHAALGGLWQPGEQLGGSGSSSFPSESASPEVITSLLSLLKDNFKCMTGNSRESRGAVGAAEDLSPARGDVFLLWNQTPVREHSCKFISLFLLCYLFH